MGRLDFSWHGTKIGPVTEDQNAMTAQRSADWARYGEEIRQVGDLLTTSGVDGVYPPGLPVAKISRIERRAESAFAKIYCTPQALVTGARHVMVVKPVSGDIPARPPAPQAVAAPKKGASK